MLLLFEFFFQGGLDVENPAVKPAFTHQLIVGALLGDPAVFKHDNPVSVAGTVDPLGDDDGCDIVDFVYSNNVFQNYASHIGNGSSGVFARATASPF